MEDYSEYIIQGEPDKRERVRNWMTAIGLQDVDDLKPSQYFLDTVRQNIEGKITLEEVRKLVDQYYTTKEGRQQEKRTEEADKVAVRIAELIAYKTFNFRPNCLASIAICLKASTSLLVYTEITTLPSLSSFCVVTP